MNFTNDEEISPMYFIKLYSRLTNFCNFYLYIQKHIYINSTITIKEHQAVIESLNFIHNYDILNLLVIINLARITISFKLTGSPPTKLKI